MNVIKCQTPELSKKNLGMKFVPYPYFIVYDFEALLKKLKIAQTSDLSIDSSHIPVSIAINDNLSNNPTFIENSHTETLIKSFKEELTRRQKVISEGVWETYPMIDKESLPKQVQCRWTQWIEQVPVFGFNSRKYDLNMIKEFFVKTLSDMNDVAVAKKDNSCMFLMSPTFKFLDVKNYLAPGLSLDDWCRTNKCQVEKLVFPYEWLDSYDKLSHVGPVTHCEFYSSLKGKNITTEEYEDFVSEFHKRGCATIMDRLKEYNLADVMPFVEAL